MKKTSVQRDPETGLPNYLCVGNRIKTARAQVICTVVDSAFLQSMTDSTSQVHQTAAETSGSQFFNVEMAGRAVVPELSPGTTALGTQTLPDIIVTLHDALEGSVVASAE